MKIPKFLLYGENDPEVEASIQPQLALRKWSDLTDKEKQIAFQQLKNKGWVKQNSIEIYQTIEYLNHHYLRQCPGRHLHAIPLQLNRHEYSNELEIIKAATTDFEHIFLQEKKDSMIFRMLSKFVKCHIDDFKYKRASETENEGERGKIVEEAFNRFDLLANCLNHIFEQFAVNQIITRNGFVPRQDKKITDEVYKPTLQVLADPKWESVSADLAQMFEDYRNKNYAETITKAHSVVHRFLQILVGEEGKSGKGEVSKLFKKAKENEIIPINRFTEQLVCVIQGFIASERATNSTAKPSLKDATNSDALLMMNLVMVFLQYCLQK